MFDKLRQSFGNLIKRFAETDLKHEDLDSILADFRLALIESDVAVIVAEHICEEIRKHLVGVRIGRFDDKSILVKDALIDIILKIFYPKEKKDFIKVIEEKRWIKEPAIITFIGVNGTGKTTTIAKISHLLLNKGFSTVLAASDTFRAGSIEQLEIHAERLGVRIIKHQYGADSAAVAFDSVQYARTKGINVVLIDTAGRMQTNRNLMMEIQKIVRVIKPDLVLFIGDALAGNDVVSQAEEFSKSVEIDGSILTKLDADVKGGAAISVSYVTRKPIYYIGIGQEYEDLEVFNPEEMVKRILETN